MKHSSSPSAGTKSGARDEIEGTAKCVAGKIKEETGKVLGNPGLECRGDRDQVDGAIQKEIGKLKRALGN